MKEVINYLAEGIKVIIILSRIEQPAQLHRILKAPDPIPFSMLNIKS
jgi:hypothetical protein